jgi:hypothetical protein
VRNLSESLMSRFEMCHENVMYLASQLFPNLCETVISSNVAAVEGAPPRAMIAIGVFLFFGATLADHMWTLWRARAMVATVLTILITIYAVHALAKFGFFFVLSYRSRCNALDRAYAGKAGATKTADAVLLVVDVVIRSARFSGISTNARDFEAKRRYSLERVMLNSFTAPPCLHYDSFCCRDAK